MIFTMTFVDLIFSSTVDKLISPSKVETCVCEGRENVDITDMHARVWGLRRCSGQI